MYVIKEKPEDFVVEEVFDFVPGKGPYSYYLMEKRNITTLDACSRIAKALHIPCKYIKWAGNKDKLAVTRQHISIYKAQNAEKPNLADIKLTFLGQSMVQMHLGAHASNRFVITVRDVTEKNLDTDKVPNYFGEQRFSSNNAEVGKMIVKREFKKASEMIENESVQRHLSKNPNDHIGAIRELPSTLLKLYVHSYQSLLWNRVAGLCLSTKENIEVQIIGFGTIIGTDKISNSVKQVMEQEGINSRDFIIREIPLASVEGGARKLYMEVKDFECEWSDDEAHKDKKKAVLRFLLPKGSYATVLIRHLFGENLNNPQ
ncbi:MAG: tRNA pseudouridine(13) synthase TruD [Candidatus Woesearchaeota archaeon]